MFYELFHELLSGSKYTWFELMRKTLHELGSAYLSLWSKTQGSVCQLSTLARPQTACNQGPWQTENHSVHYGGERPQHALSADRVDSRLRTSRQKMIKGCSRKKRNSLTSKTRASSEAPKPLPIQAATSWILGTVAETRMNRINEPRNFILDATTSSVLPRDSCKMWTLQKRLIGFGNVGSIASLDSLPHPPGRAGFEIEFVHVHALKYFNAL